MRYLHTMIRIQNLEDSLEFYCTHLGLIETNRIHNETGRYTLVFLATPTDAENAHSTDAPLLELTYNWPDVDGTVEEYAGGRNFGHVAFEVDDIYNLCKRLHAAGITINRPPRDGHMAFIKSPDNISIELLQKGKSLPPQSPWTEMENIGSW